MYGVLMNIAASCSWYVSYLGVDVSLLTLFVQDIIEIIDGWFAAQQVKRNESQRDTKLYSVSASASSLSWRSRSSLPS